MKGSGITTLPATSMTRYLTIGFLIFTLICCNSDDHYRISCCEDGQYYHDHNGILFLTESANYQSLQTLQDTAGLKKYLSEDEMKSAFDTTVAFREWDTLNYYNTEIVPWDTLFVTENFSAELVLLKDNINPRGYYFQIRTFDKHRNLISVQDFATWSDRKNKYCSGDFVENKQTFTITCGEIKSEYKFDNSGRIVNITPGNSF